MPLRTASATLEEEMSPTGEETSIAAMRDVATVTVNCEIIAYSEKNKGVSVDSIPDILGAIPGGRL
ncbi:hypothetical protein GCM10010464_86220 [Pseudonocardia yunnanensis]